MPVESVCNGMRDESSNYFIVEWGCRDSEVNLTWAWVYRWVILGGVTELRELLLSLPCRKMSAHDLN